MMCCESNNFKNNILSLNFFKFIVKPKLCETKFGELFF